MRLYRGGTVTVARPDDWSPADWRPRRSRGGGGDQRERPAGSADAPAVEGVDDDAAFVGIRCRVSTPGYEIPPRIDRVEVNVVRAHHRSARSEAVLRRPDGATETTAHPNQTFHFTDPPVLAADIDVVSGRGSEERRERWTEVADFDASGPDDRHYILEAEPGVVRFGDNVRGAVPPAGRRVVAASSVHGGGVDGNVPRTATWAFSPRPDAERTGRAPWRELAAVSAVGPATGGRDAETVDSAVARLRRELETPYRAVTAEDYRYLATNTPGIRVARASARVLPAAGPDGADVTRVTVMPHSTLPKSVEPAPSAGLLAAVERHLSAHRLVTDRVEVAPPEYVGVGVAVEARIVPGYAIDGRTRAIAAALDEFLDPLTGFDSEGWPFGRPVYKSELYGVVKEVPGVDWVTDVAIRAEGHDGVDEEGNVLVGESAVVRSLAHDVSVQFRSETDGVSR
jgi:predicted phage baseplate assembly protein